MVVFAGDHGLAARGVSAFPSDVTWQMVENFLAGGAAVSVLARQYGLALTVVDCGVARDIAPREAAPGQPRLLLRKVAPGTQDASTGPAMSAAQCAQALNNGIELVRDLPGNVLLLGEMGIANTSVASLLLARLCGLPIAECTGAGTGLDAAGIERKRAVLQQALDANAAATTPLDALAALGGYEVATMVGAVLQAAHERRVILVDGFITSAAVLGGLPIAAPSSAALRVRPPLGRARAWLDAGTIAGRAAAGPGPAPGRRLGRRAGLAAAAIGLRHLARDGEF